MIPFFPAMINQRDFETGKSYGIRRMLTKFRVTNYKCLADVELPLTPVHVVIGQNDSGKTSLLEAMLAFSRTAEVTLTDAFQGRWEGDELVFEGSASPLVGFMGSFSVDASPGSVDLAYQLEVEFAKEGKLCLTRAEWIDTSERKRIGSSRSPTTAIYSWRHYPDQAIAPILEKLARVIGPAAIYGFYPRMMATPASFDEGRKFRMDPDGFGLSTMLDDILGNDAQRFLELQARFADFFPQFRKVRLEVEKSLSRQNQFDPGGLQSATMQNGKGIYFETTHHKTIPARQASDGAILFLGLLALIYSPKPPRLLLLEEPEKGVYPLRLTQIVELIRELGAQTSETPVPQIVMTTHSPYLLSLFQPEEVTLLSRPEPSAPVRARPLREAPQIHERLGNDEFYLGELWYNLSEEELFQDA